jgi:hypothetical protein
VVLAALLTVPLMATGWIEHDPQRVMGRLAQVFILCGLWPFLRWTGLAERRALGYGVGRWSFLGGLAGGWVLGVGILGMLVGTLLLLQIRIPDPDIPVQTAWWIEKALGVLLAGLLIGLLEETFFRGALFAAVRRRGGAVQAAGWSALLYALVHFLKPHGLPPGVAFDWAGAWLMFQQVFTGLCAWQHLDSLAALLAAGLFLGLVRERSGHIGWCIGLHAGWVFVIQLTRRATDQPEGAALGFLVGDYDGVIGWLAALWIAWLTWAWWRLRVSRRSGIAGSAVL